MVKLVQDVDSFFCFCVYSCDLNCAMCHLIDKINLCVSHAAVIEWSQRLSYRLLSLNSLRLFQASTFPRCCPAPWEDLPLQTTSWSVEETHLFRERIFHKKTRMKPGEKEYA